MSFEPPRTRKPSRSEPGSRWLPLEAVLIGGLWLVAVAGGIRAFLTLAAG